MNRLKSRLFRRLNFSAAHFYQVSQWTPEQNRETFGSCYSPHGHGHDFVLEVCLEGEVDPLTGMILNLKDLDPILQELQKQLNQKHLNFEIPEFREKNPTTENLAQFCWIEIQSRLARLPKTAALTSPGQLLRRVRVYETPELFSEIVRE